MILVDLRFRVFARGWLAHAVFEFSEAFDFLHLTHFQFDYKKYALV